MPESTTIALIRAKQNVKAAEAVEESLKKKADQEALAKAFAPLKEIFEEVADMPAKDYKWHGTRKDLKLRDHICETGSDPDTRLKFWGGGGDVEVQFYAICAEGQPQLRRSGKDFAGSSQRSTLLTLEEAKDQLLAVIAERIILPDEKPDL